MSTSGIASGGAGSMIQMLQQRLFSSIDSNSDGSITKTEMESAVTGAGGTTEEADALFGALDTSDGGSVTSAQLVSGLQSGLLSSGMMSQLIGLQASSGGSGSSPISDLFASIDSDGDGSITKSELEDAVSKAGGTNEEADALYSKLDTGDTGSISEEQFAKAMMPPPPPPPPDSDSDSDTTSSASASSSTSTSSASDAEDALKLLLEALNGADSNDTAQTSGSNGSSDDLASSAFQHLIDAMQSASSSDGSNGDPSSTSGQSSLAASAMQELLKYYIQNISASTSGLTGSTSA